MEISDYGGGSSPLLVYLFIITITFLLLGFLAYIMWEIYKKVKFDKICKLVGFTGEETGLIKSFIKKTHIKDPLLILIKKANFDNFTNQIAHFFSNTEISDESLEKEEHTFGQMREKLKLRHKFRTKKLLSSHALTTGHPLTIKFYDKGTNNTLSYETEVIESNEFFLRIAPPPMELQDDFMQNKKNSIEVVFIREHDAEYHFDSIIYKSIKMPQEVLFIAHSKSLLKGAAQKSINIPASIIYHHNETVNELGAIITILDKDCCVFTLKKNTVKIEKDTSVLINLTLNEKILALQGSIINIIKRSSGKRFRMQFNNMKEDTKKDLLHFMIKNNSKKKKEKK